MLLICHRPLRGRHGARVGRPDAGRRPGAASTRARATTSSRSGRRAAMRRPASRRGRRRAHGCLCFPAWAPRRAAECSTSWRGTAPSEALGASGGRSRIPTPAHASTDMQTYTCTAVDRSINLAARSGRGRPCPPCPRPPRARIRGQRVRNLVAGVGAPAACASRPPAPGAPRSRGGSATASIGAVASVVQPVRPGPARVAHGLGRLDSDPHTGAHGHRYAPPLPLPAHRTGWPSEGDAAPAHRSALVASAASHLGASRRRARRPRSARHPWRPLGESRGALDPKPGHL